ncbi:HpcH/HpaI aldolase family protein [Klebsiella quasipneumoniae]|uniref:HpcH/HpaI aldolase family protein n=1 Tax=Klebsiella quasipneumoniae TaxID=1463165 RepID=UPI000CEBEB4F|nr:aldolase/citrate lyase family protein [Klebsiella quasipneumoniae]ROC60470.1 2,4-dihydroxyhept-2-ene-1,7-dioic acid aldolase [Klebsiella quasipneumoniae subsp. quasipneumoniae]
MKMKNILKENISNNIPFAGVTLNFGSTRATEILARAGFDFLMVDYQHGNFDKNSATDSIHAILATNTIPLARVAANTPDAINDVLDSGAMGVVIPMVENAADAYSAVRAALYSPLGKRSKGGAAPIIYGDDYAEKSNAEIMIIIMIETVDGLNNIDEILAVGGITACLIGSSDLSLDMKCDRDSDELRAAIRKIIEAGEKYGIPIGSAVGTVTEITKFPEPRPAFYLISHDQGLLKAAGSRLSEDVMKAIGRQG